MAGVLLTGCAAGTSLSGLSPSVSPSVPPSVPAPCAAEALTVTFPDDGVHARNTGTTACSLAGTHPVEVPWWRTQGPTPQPAAGVLAPGAALVQEFRLVSSNGCPGLSAAAGASPSGLDVLVEGSSHRVPMTAQRVFVITSCLVMAALPPRISPTG